MRFVEFIDNKEVCHGWLHTFSIPKTTQDTPQSVICVVENTATGVVKCIRYNNIKLLDIDASLRICNIIDKEYYFHEFITLNGEAYALIESDGFLKVVLPNKIIFKR